MKNYLLGLATLPAALVALGIATRIVDWIDGRLAVLRPITRLRPEYQERTLTFLPPAPKRRGLIIRLPHWHHIGLLTGYHIRPRRKRTVLRTTRPRW